MMRSPAFVPALLLFAAWSTRAAEPPLLSSINWDFESGTLEGWTVLSGNLGKQPASNDNDRWGGNFNKHGKYFIGTYEDGAVAVGDARTGEIRSPVFVIDMDGLAMRVSGGASPTTCVALCDAADDSELQKVSGKNSEAMREVVLDVSAYRQKKVYLKIVDKSTTTWGHINLDYVRAAKPATMAPTVLAKAEPKDPETPVAESKPPQAIPDAALLPAAESLVRDFFKADYGKPDLADRAKLVKKLLLEAAQTNTDLDLKYVLFREAYDTARNSGQFELAMAAARQMARAFQVDEAKLKTDVIAKAAPSTPEGQQVLLDCILREVDDAVTRDRYAEALQLLDLARVWATKLKDAALGTRLQSQARELALRQTAFEKYDAARRVLAEKRDDPESHLAIGAYLCFHKQQWQTGLPHLATCSVPALKDAAASELQRPTEAAAQADLADLWWAQAEKESGPPKVSLQQHATVWYIESFAGLPDARKAIIEKRLQAGSGLMGAAVAKLRAAGLVFYVNPCADLTGKARDLVSNAPATNVGPVSTVADSGIKALQFANSYVSYPATDAVKAITTSGSFFVWIKHEKSIGGTYAAVIFRGTAPDAKGDKGVADFSLFLCEDKFRLWFNWPENEWPGVNGKTVFLSKNPLPVGKWTMCGATWNGTTIAIYINGERDNTYAATLTPLPRKFPEMVALGCDPAGSPEYYPGMLSCAMIFNRALTDAEVKQLHLMAGALGTSVPRE